MLSGWGFDIEADGFYLQSTKIWTIHFKSICGRSMRVNPFKEGKEEAKRKTAEWIKSFPDGSFVFAHNGFGFDFWMLWKFLDIPFIKNYKGKDYLGKKVVVLVDTFAMSQFIDPDKFGGHSLDAISQDHGSYKIDYREKLIEVGALDKDSPKGHEFSFYHPLMEDYCEQDTSALVSIFIGFYNKLKELYQGKIPKSFHQHQKDYYLYGAQAICGVKFNREKGAALVPKITAMMQEIEDYVLPQLPPRKLKKGEQKEYTLPAKPFKKDGSFSSHMNNFISKHNGIVKEGNIVEFYGKDYKIEGGLLLDVEVKMEIKDGDDLKAWFMEQGWNPTLWNVKKDDRGKPIKDENGDAIRTSPKLQEQGKLCPNLEVLEGDLPKHIVRFLSLRNRRSVLEGWLADERLDYDGRLSTTITGYTPTFRVKHSKIVNVPKADPNVLLGEEFRELFECEEGSRYIGADAAALENRTLGHYTTKYDGGSFAQMMLDGDPHSISAFDFYPEETKQFKLDQPGLKDDPVFKKYRAAGKTGNYLLGYGGGYKKLASSLGLPLHKAEIAFNNYWDSRPGLKAFKEALERYWKDRGGKKRIPAIDGRWLSSRSKHVLVNLEGQSCGAIVMSIAACYMDEWLGGMLRLDEKLRPYYLYKGHKVMRVSMFHDEYSWEVFENKKDTLENVAEEIAEMCVKAIVKAGEDLNLRIPLDGEAKIGLNWRDVH